MRADGVRQAAIGIGVLLALGGPAGAQEWTAQEIVDRAVARADAQRDAQDDIRYRATFEAITERLNGDGEVEETERETYEQYPLEGVIYEELVAREGMPLTAADERKEQERRAGVRRGGARATGARNRSPPGGREPRGAERGLHLPLSVLHRR